MKSYKEMKTALIAVRENVKHFTKEFYNIFVEDYRRAIQNSISGVDTEEFVNTKQTDFYNKNSSCYCVFLELFYDTGNLKKFRIDYYMDAYGNGVKYVYDYAENEETMKQLAFAKMNKDIFKFAEVIKVA